MALKAHNPTPHDRRTALTAARDRLLYRDPAGRIWRRSPTDHLGRSIAGESRIVYQEYL